ncbi:MAG: acyl-CoA dehydrogenase family protein [Planctomycetota bacterium]
MHNLELTEDQTMILDTVRKLVSDAVEPSVLDLDEHRRHARAPFEALTELGLFGIPVPEDRGGAGMGLLPLVAALEEIGSCSASLARLLIEQSSAALALCAGPADAAEPVIAGTPAVFLGPEHGIRAAADSIEGVAEFAPGGGTAEILVVVASDNGSVVLLTVPGDAAERKDLKSLGLRSSAPSRIRFSGAAATRVATGEAAAAAILRAQICRWIGTAAVAVGMGRASVEAARKHASERIAFGKPLLRQAAVARKLVESRRLVDAARHLAFHAARLFDLGQDAEAAAMQARIAAVDAAVSAADEGIQIHGGFGYVVEYHVERHYRDAKTLEVLDGGNASLRDRLAELQFA